MGLVLGLMVWNGVSFVTGRREAWDGNLLLYAGSLFAAGLAAGFIARLSWKSAVAGIYFGQIIAMLIRSGGEAGNLFPLGLILLAVFTSLSATAAFIVSLRK